MTLTEPWNRTPASDAKLNLMTNISTDGTTLLGLDRTKHKILICTADGSGLIADHVYLCSSDGLTLIDLSNVDVHTHSNSTDGGSLLDITNANKDVLDSGLSLMLKPTKSSWVEITNGTASVADDVDGTSAEYSIKLATGATSGSAANIKIPSIDFDMSKRSWFKLMQRLSSTSDIAFRAGYGMINLSAADTNQRQYGIEGCTTVNGNYFVRTASGSARSASDTGTAFAASRASIRCEHYPDLGTPKVDTYINEGTVFTKTSNIPTTYLNDEPAPDNIFRFSLKNNTTADKNLFAYGIRLVYQASSDWI